MRLELIYHHVCKDNAELILHIILLHYCVELSLYLEPCYDFITKITLNLLNLYDEFSGFLLLEFWGQCTFSPPHLSLSLNLISCLYYSDLLSSTSQQGLAHMERLKLKKEVSVQKHSHGCGMCCFQGVLMQLVFILLMILLLDNLLLWFQPQLSMLLPQMLGIILHMHLSFLCSFPVFCKNIISWIKPSPYFNLRHAFEKWELHIFLIGNDTNIY